MIPVESLGPAPIPEDLAANAEAVLDEIPDEDTRWRVERVIELGYHQGYGDGHTRGWRNGAAHQARAWPAEPGPQTQPNPAPRKGKDA